MTLSALPYGSYAELAMNGTMNWVFGTGDYLSRGACMKWDANVLPWDIAANTATAIACLVMALGFFIFAERRRDFNLSSKMVARLIGALFFVQSLQNVMAILVIWQPMYGLQTILKITAAMLTVMSAAVLWPLRERFLRIPSAGHLREVEGRIKDLNERISISHAEIEQRIDERTTELQMVRQRFQQALRGAEISVFTQDKNLRYLWAFTPDPAAAENAIGKTDFEIIAPSSCGPVVALKQRAIASGKPVEGEVSITDHGREKWYRMHIEPVMDKQGNVVSLNGISVDISDRKMLEDEQVRLSSELAANLQYYKLAMESSHTVVFTLDQELKFMTMSHEFLGEPPSHYIGHTNAEVLSPENYAFMKPLKQKAIESGETVRAEIKARVDGTHRWYDVSLSPLKNRAGHVIGLTGAAIDISERKGWEQHLRLLMRELTHRSKNLLAVIQAMARQTARHSDSIEAFIERFSARLHALAGSHDLLVQESWQRASIRELISSQLGHYSDLVGTQIIVKGPQVYLTPDAAQNLGMALHEMATNAVKYGALSAPNGQVTIAWEWKGQGAKRVLRMAWREKGGPTVKAPTSRGFGSQVIERNLTRALGAEVRLDYASSGFKAEMNLPQTLVVDIDAEEGEAPTEPTGI